MSRRDRLVIIPAFNEADAIGGVVSQCHARAPDFDVLVIDDGSSDATAAIAAQCGATVLRHPFNMNYGAALQTGYRYAARYGYAVAVQLDADGQHDPADAPRLADPILSGRADVVLGSRFLEHSTYEMPVLRRIGSHWFRFLVRAITGLSVTDPTTGLQGLSRNVLELYSSDVFPIDYPDADMLVLLRRNGFRIEEVPVQMKQRADSRSMHAGLGVLYYVYKMSLSILMNAFRAPIVRRP
jgi:glycosyltransferase involved in cell wall biosynthesis